MKFKVKNRSKAPVLAMTSMLDVIFLLLCFFVTASVFSQWESEISIKLPAAATAEQPERLPGEIIVNLSKQGVVTVNGQALKLADLQQRLVRISRFYPGQQVIIRADRDTRYDELVKVIDTCRAANVWNFSLATEGETAGKSSEGAK